MSTNDPTLDAALEAIRRGFQPIPIRLGTKRPTMSGWPHITWEPETTAEQFRARIAEWGFGEDDPYNLGVILGPSSGGLVDVDIDHPRAKRFRDLLPRTQARSGRPGSPDSHYWYLVEGDNIPSTRRYKLADQTTVTIEFRYDRGVQTIIPPSDWVPKDWDDLKRNPAFIEIRNWSRDPWGGTRGPAKVGGRQLATQVALIGLGTVLLDNWPTSGSRHDAYLALAGSLMRMGDGLVHPFWEKNASVLIRALADASKDDDGPDAREAESIGSTLKGIRDGKPVWGFPKLAEILGDDQVAMVRTLVAEVESLAGFQSRQAAATPAPPASSPLPAGNAPTPPDSAASAAPTAGEDGEPLELPAASEKALEIGSWNAIELDPYLSGQFQAVAPSVLVRDDGRALFYPGRLNMLFAPSESGKTLLALYTCLEVMATGERVVYLDFEDEPVNTIERLRSMGASDDDLRLQFTYIRPDEPIASMQRDNWGNHRSTPVGELNAIAFSNVLDQVDPALIIADGMTSIYGLHGLDSNNSVETDVITNWLKSLSRDGRTTVIIIDHMAKSGERGSMPIGSQHKVSMVQGTLLQVWPKQQPVLGTVGELELIVLKDRPGQVRKYAGRINGKAQVAATVLVDSTINDGTQTRFTIKAPAPSATKNGTAASGAVLQIDPNDAAKAFRKLEIIETQDLLFLAPFKGVVGSNLKYPVIKKSIASRWTSNRFTNTSMEATRNRLVDASYLMKNGGAAGPKVTYELTATGADHFVRILGNRVASNAK